MRIIFAGTPAFAATHLAKLIENNHEICAVYTQPDRPAGRGRKPTASPVKHLAEQYHLPVEQPLSLKNAEAQAQLASYQADLMIVVAYGLLLPQAVLDTPKYGCLNVHASLLPRWRGAAPIQRAILAGDAETGVCIMQMEAGLDTGPVLLRATCPITTTDFAESLHDKLAELGAQTLITVLNNLSARQAAAQIQDDTYSNYAKKLEKQEAIIDWQQPALAIDRQIRALNPWPVAQTTWQGEVLRIWSAALCDSPSHHAPGTLIAVDKSGLTVATREGSLKITEVQLPGKRRMAVADLLNAQKISVGEQLG